MKRAVNVALIPADASRAAPDMIELHLKGTQQRKRIPLQVLADVVWPPVKKVEKAAMGHNDRVAASFEKGNR